jgi:hypothetical protein
LAINWIVEIPLINIFKLKNRWALIATSHHILGVLKGHMSKWSMKVPWCATCHHLSGINFND